MQHIGRSVAFPGHPLGSGLTPTSAKASKNNVAFDLKYKLYCDPLSRFFIYTICVSRNASAVKVM